MDIALPAIIVFLLITPGFIFRAQFKVAERETFDFSPFGRVVGQAFLWTLLLHGLWLTLAHMIFGLELNNKTLVDLLTSEPEKISFENLSEDITKVTLYFSSLYFFCWIVPPILRAIIIRYRLDREDTNWGLLFHMDAPWHYILSGGNLENTPDMVFVSVIVKVGEEPIIYKGILYDYIVDRHTGELNRIVLSGTYRWKLSTYDDAPPDKKMDLGTLIIGNLFVISYEDIITLNIEYLNARD